MLQILFSAAKNRIILVKYEALNSLTSAVFHECSIEKLICEDIMLIVYDKGNSTNSNCNYFAVKQKMLLLH
jgi:hypothetical protein